jgi:hypothetical protein
MMRVWWRYEGAGWCSSTSPPQLGVGGNLALSCFDETAPGFGCSLCAGLAGDQNHARTEHCSNSNSMAA